MGVIDGAAVLLDNGGTPTSPNAAPTLYDKSPSLSSAVANRATQTGIQISSSPPGWTVVSNPGAAGTASASKAAGGAGVRHVCTGIFVSVAAGATPQTPIRAYLRDGAAGVGTIIWAAVLAATTNACTWYEVTGLCIVGTANTAMTLEFEAAAAATCIPVATLTGTDIT